MVHVSHTAPRIASYVGSAWGTLCVGLLGQRAFLVAEGRTWRWDVSESPGTAPRSLSSPRPLNQSSGPRGHVTPPGESLAVLQ